MARMDDGHATLISFSGSSALVFQEKEVTPPSISGGGANDTTTMHNVTYRTKSPKKLISMGEMGAMVAYDPGIYDEIADQINVNQEITVTFPDGGELTFWGWLDDFKPNAVKEGEQPTAELTIICSNQNSSGVETAPQYTP